MGIFFTAFTGILLQKTVCMLATGPKIHKEKQFFGSRLTKKFLSTYSDYTQTFEFQYLGEFKFILKNNLG
jgi:hypothetical protein